MNLKLWGRIKKRKRKKRWTNTLGQPLSKWTWKGPTKSAASSVAFNFIWLNTVAEISKSCPKIITVSKGQKKSKCFFQADISLKKQTNEFDFTTMIPQVNLFLFVFWRKLKTPRRHFEIN